MGRLQASVQRPAEAGHYVLGGGHHRAGSRAASHTTETATSTPHPTSVTREKNIAPAELECGTRKMIVAVTPARRLAEAMLSAQHIIIVTRTAVAYTTRC